VDAHLRGGDLQGALAAVEQLERQVRFCRDRFPLPVN
jgi:hypothetical protein